MHNTLAEIIPNSSLLVSNVQEHGSAAVDSQMDAVVEENILHVPLMFHRSPPISGIY